MYEPAPAGQGLVMPRIVAVARVGDPGTWGKAGAGATAGGSRGIGIVPKEPAAAPIVCVREVLQLPVLEGPTLAAAEAAVAAWKAEEASLALQLSAREAVADDREESVREAEAQLAVAIERALQLRAEKEAACAAALAAAQQQLDTTAEAVTARAEAVVAQEAADAAARIKPKKCVLDHTIALQGHGVWYEGRMCYAVTHRGCSGAAWVLSWSV